MKVKRVFSALLAVVLLLGCLPFAASAKGMPAVLYVGEKDKTDDNLIEKYETSGSMVTVYAIDSETKAYYTLTKEKGIGYILTFYRDYRMSQMVDSTGGYCGLYCDGDLTVRIAGNVTFNANDPKYKGAYGWLVEGTLTIEGDTTGAKLTVNGSKPKNSYGEGSIGICAETIKFHDVTVDTCGGYAGVMAAETIVMGHAVLNANTQADMKDSMGEPLFEYSVVAKDYIQVGGSICADGAVDIDAFYLRDGKYQFDEKVVVYGKTYAFAEETYIGLWNEVFTVFRNPNEIPSCMNVVLAFPVRKTVAKLNGNQLVLNRRGTAVMTLEIQCGRETIIMDERAVGCEVRGLMWLPYILSLVWLEF